MDATQAPPTNQVLNDLQDRFRQLEERWDGRVPWRMLVAGGPSWPDSGSSYGASARSFGIGRRSDRRSLTKILG
jgi:hypothetical protein